MTDVVSERAQARSLIPQDLFARLVNRITVEEDIDLAFAERIMDQALAFLSTAASHSGQPLAPAPAVDIGWHTFILYTREYAEFCERVAGRFVHHVPDDAPSAVPGKGGPGTARARTVGAIERAGFLVDSEVWSDTAGSCKPGDPENGCCAASGKQGNENTENQTPPK